MNNDDERDFEEERANQELLDNPEWAPDPESEGTPATFVVIWRDDEDGAIRSCDEHIGAIARLLYRENGRTFPVEIHELNESSGFECEAADYLDIGDLLPIKEMNPEDRLATWAATQPQDNYVIRLACGHEWDSATPMTEGASVVCDQHGPTYVLGD